MIDLTDWPSPGDLKVGDVLMATRTIKTKDKQPYDWTFFCAITQVHTRSVKAIVLNEKAHEVLIVFNSTDKLFLLLPEEWPDGVHAFHTTLVLTGRLVLT